MNIIVKPYDYKLCYCRPDTTWEKESRDLYMPEGVDKILWTPVVFARICKAGKFVSEKFVTRYYDSVGFGVLLYSGEDSIAYSSCIDHSSILPLPLYNTVVLENNENHFIINIDSSERDFKMEDNIKKDIESAICTASKRTSLRIGDIVGIELAGMEELLERPGAESRLTAKFCENNLFDLKVIF